MQQTWATICLYRDSNILIVGGVKLFIVNDQLWITYNKHELQSVCAKVLTLYFFLFLINFWPNVRKMMTENFHSEVGLAFHVNMFRSSVGVGGGGETLS